MVTVLPEFAERKAMSTRKEAMKIEYRPITTPPPDYAPPVKPKKPKKPKKRNRGLEYAESWRIKDYSTDTV